MSARDADTQQAARHGIALGGRPMDALQREYDRFGPWAIEISDQDPPPRLFAPHLARSEAPLLSVKIPRHVERRNARPGLDLYDYVVCLYDEDLVVHQRNGSDVLSSTCRIRDVQHLRVTRCLLRGNIHLGLPGRPVDLPYNTVSDALMLRLVELIRQRYAREPGSRPSASMLDVPDGTLSFYFDRLLEGEGQRDPDMCLLAAQGTVPVAARSTGKLRRLAFRIADKRLLEAMHFSDGSELRILSRGPSYAYRWESTYGLETTYIPVGNLRSVDWRADPANGATTLVLGTGGGDSTFAFQEGNASIGPYAAYLASLPGLARHTMAPGSRLQAA
jgi:hypothetical protein